MRSPETLLSPQTDPNTEIVENQNKEGFTRRTFNKVAPRFAAAALVVFPTIGIDTVTTIETEVRSSPVEQLEHPPHVECVAANTKFYLTIDQVKKVKIDESGDSVAFGFFGAELPYPDASYQVNGINSNFNQLHFEDDYFPVCSWDYTDTGVIGSEVSQWRQQVKAIELDKKLKDIYPQQLDTENLEEDTDSPSETWQVGTAGNELFHFALRHKRLIEKLYTMDGIHLDMKLVKEIADELQDVYKKTKQEYREFLELVYSLKTSGEEPNLDRLVLIGMTDPTVLQEVPIENEYGNSMIIEMDNIRRKYTHNAIVNMNNTLKETINEFIADHPEFASSILWIEPALLLKEGDMHDIHPSKLGYWKIARAILDHYYVKDKDGNDIQLGPIALPDTSQPKPEQHIKKQNKKGKVTRRAFFQALKHAA
ncbi:MAG TPA: hypothetical protein VLF93_08090 [Candidatus Saccharimonadales bacterium]|nr:hypothetical protein [Candidatus Saccharimonadales bacterium]